MKKPIRLASALRLVGGMALATLANGVVSGCQHVTADTAGVSPELGEAGQETPSEVLPTTPAEIDDTDPEAFDLTESTYWDGRPSLGGLWVAHPLTRKPLRARITNLETGESVEGGLVRREAALSGPTILLSYDVARAIGVSPGKVVQIRIIALKDAETLKAEAKARVLAEQDTSLASPEVAEEAVSEDATPASAPEEAVAVIETEEIVTPSPDPAPPVDAALVDETKSTEIALPVSPATDDSVAEVAAPADDGKAVEAPKKVFLPAAEELTEEEPQAVAPPEIPGAVISTSVATAPAEVAPTPALQPAPTPQKPGVAALAGVRYVQIATFSLAKNAEKTAAEFRAEGMNSEVRSNLVGPNRMSRVLLGPFDQRSELNEAMQAARSRGFRDAIYVKR